MDTQAGGLITSANHLQQNDKEVIFGVRKGPWTVEEDSLLTNYVAIHGEGRWNTLALSSGLKRTGKSCRLRWLNYLRPDVRRGNISLQEQFTILELHSRWGNRWSKIAECLPGRTDNEIKNYWRTRVLKQAKQLKCDVDSKQFRDIMRYVWMPRLLERIQSKSDYIPSGQPTSSPSTTTSQAYHVTESGSVPNFTPETSGASSDSLVAQVSPSSDPTDGGHNTSLHGGSSCVVDNSQNGSGLYPDNVNESWGWCKPRMDIQEFEQQNNNWFGGEDSFDTLWNEEYIWLLQQQPYR